MLPGFNNGAKNVSSLCERNVGKVVALVNKNVEHVIHDLRFGRAEVLQ
jgi:hypothetical protein